MAAQRPMQPQVVAGSGQGKINREDIAAIVDKFLAGRDPAQAGGSQQSGGPPPDVEAGSMYAGPSQSARQSENAGRPGNGGRSSGSSSQASSTASLSGSNASAASSAANGRSPVDFVSEDDVRRAIQKGEKIYINAKTIITPAARDIGEPGEVFVKV
jgi:hypothetical protein